jgi:hypothetical protein
MAQKHRVAVTISDELRDEVGELDRNQSGIAARN